MKDSNILDTTVDEWRTELEKFAPAATLLVLPFLEKGKTAGELAEAFGMSSDAICRRIKKLVEAGRCVKGRGKRVAINGQEKTVPVYQLIPKKKEEL